MRALRIILGLAVGWATSEFAVAEDISPTTLEALAEPAPPENFRVNLVDALRDGGVFSLPHHDTRTGIPAGKELVWSGSSVNGETGLAVFSLMLRPESGGAEALPTRLDFTIDKEAIVLRPERPVKREYVGGLRFARVANYVRRIALRVDGVRELTAFVPAMSEGEQGFGLAFCLTEIKSEELVSKAGAKRTIESPMASPFALQAGRFTARAAIEGRIRSGVLPARAIARIARTPNLGAGFQEVDETVSQDPRVGVTYSAVNPPEFVPASRGDGVGAAIKAEVELYTPAGHRQVQTVGSAVWVERLPTPLPISGGGLDSLPKELLPKDVESVAPIYGSCFLVGGRHLRTSSYSDPVPTDQPPVKE